MFFLGLGYVGEENFGPGWAGPVHGLVEGAETGGQFAHLIGVWVHFGPPGQNAVVHLCSEVCWLSVQTPR